MFKGFLKPSGEKITLDLVISLVIVLFLFFNSTILRELFLTRTLGRQILDVALNTLILMIFLYPLSCLIVSLLNRKRLSHIPVPKPRRKSKKGKKKKR